MSLRRGLSVVAACPIHGVSPSSHEAIPRSFDEIPGPPRSIWSGLLKHQDTKDLARYWDHLHKLFEEYGPIVRVDHGPIRGSVVHIFSPEDSQTIFRCEGRIPHIVPLQETTQKYRQMRGMNPGLGNLNGEEWYRLRTAVQQSLMQPQAIEKYLPFVENTASNLVDHISKLRNRENEVDMRTIAGRWSLESAGQTVFETRLGALAERSAWADRLVNINWEIFKLSAKMKLGFPWFRFFATPSWKRMVELEDDFYAEVDRLMDNAIEELKTAGDKMLMSELISKPNLDSRDIKVIMLSLFTDGLSTTAPMLIYNLYNIAKHPEVQEKIGEEASTASVGKKLKMPYLRACIKETFRIFPIGTEISRVPQQDTVLGGYTVPAGTPVDINTNILTRSPLLFARPDQFDPSRWLRENKGEEDVHPFSFLPFGFGPRMCAGRRFAEQDLQVVLTRLVQNFRISHNHGSIRQRYETLLLPEGDCHFQLETIAH